MPSSARALEPVASLLAGMPKRTKALMPVSAASPTSPTSLSTLNWWMPGMEAISFLIPCPGRTKNGKIRSLGLKLVSRTNRRSSG